MNPLEREEELIGQSTDDVPTLDPGEKCYGQKSSGGAFQGYCRATAGRGTDHVGEGRCKHHGGASTKGREHPNFKHGAFSKHLRDDLSEREEAALEDLAGSFEDPEEARAVIREQAAEAYLKYKRSGDERFLREYRQLLAEFNIVPNEDQVEIFGDGLDMTLSVEEKEQLDDAFDAEPET